MKFHPDEYDGIFFVPDPNSESLSDLEISFFRFKDNDYANKPAIDSTKSGYMYHVAFFKSTENHEIVFDGNFEAIFADPITYVRNLAGAKVFGCLVKKTESSSEWFEDYLNRTIKHTQVKKVIGYLRSILENK